MCTFVLYFLMFTGAAHLTHNNLKFKADINFPFFILSCVDIALQPINN